MKALQRVRHAGLIARRVDGHWLGVLIEGHSGAGKSDLAWRAVAAGWRLVADDRTVVFAAAGRLWGRAPDALAGLCEARGLAVVRVTPLPLARIVLLGRCLPGPGDPPRLMSDERETVAGVALPVMALHPLAASAVALLGLAVDTVGRRVEREYQARRPRS